MSVGFDLLWDTYCHKHLVATRATPKAYPAKLEAARAVWRQMEADYPDDLLARVEEFNRKSLAATLRMRSLVEARVA